MCNSVAWLSLVELVSFPTFLSFVELLEEFNHFENTSNVEKIFCRETFYSPSGLNNVKEKNGAKKLYGKMIHLLIIQSRLNRKYKTIYCGWIPQLGKYHRGLPNYEWDYSLQHTPLISSGSTSSALSRPKYACWSMSQLGLHFIQKTSPWLSSLKCTWKSFSLSSGSWC